MPDMSNAMLKKEATEGLSLKNSSCPQPNIKRENSDLSSTKLGTSPSARTPCPMQSTCSSKTSEPSERISSASPKPLTRPEIKRSLKGSPNRSSISMTCPRVSSIPSHSMEQPTPPPPLHRKRVELGQKGSERVN